MYRKFMIALLTVLLGASVLKTFAADEVIPELVGRLDCGSLAGEGALRLFLNGNYIATFWLKCDRA
jgi:hypothetical protein